MKVFRVMSTSRAREVSVGTVRYRVQLYTYVATAALPGQTGSGPV